MSDREKLIELLDYEGCIAESCDVCEFQENLEGCYSHQKEYCVDHLISNGVTVQKYGKWKLHANGNATCTECNCLTVAVWDLDNSLNYCPHCGVKMIGNANKGTLL